MMKSRFIKVFTYLGAIFLMSHIIFNNVYAVEPSVGVEFVGGATQPYWQSSNGEAFHNTSLSVGNNVTYPNFTYIRVRNGSNQNYQVEGGAYVSLIGEVILRAHNSNSGGTAISSWASGMFGMSNDTSHTDCGIVDFDYNLQEYSQTTSPNEYYYRYTVEMICRVQSAGATNPTLNFNLTTVGSTGSVVASFNLRRISVYKPVGAFDDSAIISAIRSVNTKLQDVIDALDILGDKMDDVSSSISDAQQNEEQATQDAADNSATSGDQASTDATTATSSLLSVIGGFVSVITSASPSNCVIDAPLNTAFSNDRFHVDLCGLDLPQGIGALTSIMVIMLIVPFCISMFNKFIGIISEFQR